MRKNIVAVAIVALLLSAGGAFAASQISGKNIKDGSITGADIKTGSVATSDLTSGVQKALDGKDGKDGAKGATGAAGPAGPAGLAGAPGAKGDAGAKGDKGDAGAKGDKGDKGDTGDAKLAGAYYSVANYNAGDTNGGAIATVACKAQTDTAISGGVSVTDYVGNAPSNVPVGQSYPGRMDYDGLDDIPNNADDNRPRANRLDGWIVQFASQDESAPKKVKVWALCVPGLVVPVEETYTQSAG